MISVAHTVGPREPFLIHLSGYQAETDEGQAQAEHLHAGRAPVLPGPGQPGGAEDALRQVRAVLSEGALQRTEAAGVEHDRVGKRIMYGEKEAFA